MKQIELVISNQPPKGQFLKSFNEMLALRTAVRDLLLNTTLHGCRHLAEDGRHWLERIIWILVQVIAMLGVTKSVMDVYLEYMSTPSVTSLETTQYPAWNVPFPAVGICNVNKISKRNAEELANELLPHTDGNGNKKELVEMLYYVGNFYTSEPTGYKIFQDLSRIMKAANMTIGEILQRLSPSCASLLQQCRWRGRQRPCHHLFNPMPTVNGFCCIFNIIPDNEEETLAETLQSTGYKHGLTVVADPQPDDYYFPFVPTYGIQLMVFPPLTYPENSNGMIEYVAATGREWFFTVSISTQYSSPELASFPSKERGCVFQSETHSRYTSSNCLHNCYQDFILKHCRCLPYYHRNISNSQLCDLIDIPCLSRAKLKFQQFLQDTSEDGGEDDDVTLPCGSCLPACTSTWYDVQSSFAKIDNRQANASVSAMNGYNVKQHMTVVHIYYHTLDTTLYKQDVIYTRTELVSNFGGICSLFNGFSFLSLVEVIYFLTIRFFLNLRQNRRDSNQIDSQPRDEPQDRQGQSPYWNEMRINTPQPSQLFTSRSRPNFNYHW